MTMRTVLRTLRKEKPVPGPKPPQPPPKTGIQTPGRSTPSSGGMVCSNARPRRHRGD